MVTPLKVVKKTTLTNTAKLNGMPKRADAFLLLEPLQSSVRSGNPGDYRLVFETGQEIIVTPEIFVADYKLV